MRPSSSIRDDHGADGVLHVVSRETGAGDRFSPIVPSASAEEVVDRLALWLADVALEAASQSDAARTVRPVVKGPAS
jgi:hypothetical protein